MTEIRDDWNKSACIRKGMVGEGRKSVKKADKRSKGIPEIDKGCL